MSFWKNRRVIVTGGSGFLGQHLRTRLGLAGALVAIPDSWNFDLRRRDDARAIYDFVAPDAEPQPVLFHLAARVSGIGAITKHPATSLHDNLIMGLNVLQAAADSLYTGKIVLAGSVCAYPKYAPQPMVEENLWQGYPEESNGPYGIAKRTLAVAADSYRKQYGLQTIYPLLANLYGPGDHIDPETSHVIPALMRKMIEAKMRDEPEVVVWGTGQASRDFLYVADAADALMTAAEKLDSAEPINIGTGQEMTISALAMLIQKIVGYRGRLVQDMSKPDGQPRRCLQTREARIQMDWQHKTFLDDGLQSTFEWLEPIIRAEVGEQMAQEQEDDAVLRKLGFKV